MPPTQYEYEVEPMFISPNELENATYAFDDLLNGRANDGWELDETLRVDSDVSVHLPPTRRRRR